MAAMSDYLENAILNATLRGTAWTPPTTVHLALYTSDPTDAKTGTEVTGGAYARQVITFSAPTNGVVSSAADVLYPIATANWGTVTHIGILDANTSGNLLYHGALTNSKTIASSDQLKIAAGDITVTLA
ncbi:phage tail fiber protein [Sporosarcina sp. CAU 1771]